MSAETNSKIRKQLPSGSLVVALARREVKDSENPNTISKIAQATVNRLSSAREFLNRVSLGQGASQFNTAGSQSADEESHRSQGTSCLDSPGSTHRVLEKQKSLSRLLLAPLFPSSSKKKSAKEATYHKQNARMHEINSGATQTQVSIQPVHSKALMHMFLSDSNKSGSIEEASFAPRHEYETYMETLREFVALFQENHFLSGSFLHSQPSHVSSEAYLKAEAFFQGIQLRKRSLRNQFQLSIGISGTRFGDKLERMLEQTSLSLLPTENFKMLMGFIKLKDTHISELAHRVDKILSLDALENDCIEFPIQELKKFKETLFKICRDLHRHSPRPLLENCMDEAIKSLCEHAAAIIIAKRNAAIEKVLKDSTTSSLKKQELVHHYLLLGESLTSICELEWLYRGKLEFHNLDHSFEVAEDASMLMQGMGPWWGASQKLAFSGGIKHDIRMAFENLDEKAFRRFAGRDKECSEGLSHANWSQSFEQTQQDLFYLFPELVHLFPEGKILTDWQKHYTKEGIADTVPEFLDLPKKDSDIPALGCISNGGELIRLPVGKNDSVNPALVSRNPDTQELEITVQQRVKVYQEMFELKPDMAKKALKKIFFDGVAIPIADLAKPQKNPAEWSYVDTDRLFSEMYPDKVRQIDLYLSKVTKEPAEFLQAIEDYKAFVTSQETFAAGRATILEERVLFPCMALLSHLKNCQRQLNNTSSKVEMQVYLATKLGMGSLFCFEDRSLPAQMLLEGLSQEATPPSEVLISRSLSQVIAYVETFLANLQRHYCKGNGNLANREACEYIQARLGDFDTMGSNQVALSLMMSLENSNGYKAVASNHAWKKFAHAAKSTECFLYY